MTGIDLWTLATPFSSIYPEAYGAYVDDALYSDSCERLSLAVGIAEIADAPVWAPYTQRGFIIKMSGEAGTASSDFGATLQAVSNECNDAGLDPRSDCMGLNTNRTMPNGWEKNTPLINPDRGWTMPDCYWYTAQTGPEFSNYCPV